MINNFKLNKFFLKYESTCLQDYINGVEQSGQAVNKIIEKGKLIDAKQFSLFLNEKNEDLKEELMTEQTQSPYKILQKFVIWEIMDLEAIIEAIN